MKLSSIKALVVLLFVALSCSPTASAQSQTINKADHPTTADKYEKIQQKFNPIYGSEKESNDLLSFIAANMVLELDAAAVKNIDGIVVVSFYLDTLGCIDRLAVTKSLRPWIDFAIIGGLKRMPNYGKPSIRNNGKAYESRHSMVFSFGSYIRGGGHTYGFQGDAVRNKTQEELNRQRNDHFAKINEQTALWNKFTTKNSKLEYDTKSGLKNQAGTLAPDDQLGTPDALPPMTPTVTITNREL